MVLVIILCSLLTASCQNPKQSNSNSTKHLKTQLENPEKSELQKPVKQTGKYKALIKDLSESIPEMMDDVDIPGLSIALINESGIIWQGNFGIKSVKTKAPVDDSTVFVAASFSKVVFGYLILKMVDEQKIDLDTPLIRYAPKSFIENEFKKIKDERFNEITARMVLSHSTGFPDHRIFGRSVKIDFTPGSNFSYSGEAFFLLQKIVEYIEGKPINIIMKEKVFDPLGMNNTSYVYEERFKNKMARGHDHWLSFLFNWIMLKNHKAHTARSLLTTTKDFAKFMIAFMNGKDLNNKTFSDALTIQINANSDHIFWGLSIGMEIINGDTTYWHDGEALIFENYFAFNKKQDIGFVYFSNSANGLSIGEKITEEIIPAYHPSFRWIGIEQYYSTTNQLTKAFNNKGIDESIKLYFELKEKYPWKIREYVLNDFGYFLLRRKKIDEAIRIFKLNVKEYPDSWNVYDSLGDAYLKKGDKELALENYKKSLELSPDNRNALEMLNKLKN